MNGGGNRTQGKHADQPDTAGRTMAEQADTANKPQKKKKDAHAPSIKTSNHQTYQAIITKFISNRKEGREEEKKKLKRMKNRCTEEVQEVQALGQLVSVS